MTRIFDHIESVLNEERDPVFESELLLEEEIQKRGILIFGKGRERGESTTNFNCFERR